MKKNILEKVNYKNQKILDVSGDDYIFTIKSNNFEITFGDYDIDNDYSIRNRVIYKLDEFNIIEDKYALSLLIFMEDSNLLEKVTITSKYVNVKIFKNNKIFKEEILESK